MQSKRDLEKLIKLTADELQKEPNPGEEKYIERLQDAHFKFQMEYKQRFGEHYIWI